MSRPLFIVVVALPPPPLPLLLAPRAEVLEYIFGKRKREVSSQKEKQEGEKQWPHGSQGDKAKPEGKSGRREVGQNATPGGKLWVGSQRAAHLYRPHIQTQKGTTEENLAEKMI
eukprot:RCo029090